MTFPTTGILDNFNRADGALGANWSTPVFSGDGTAAIAGNKVSVGVPWRSNYWNPSSFNADVEVTCTFVSITNALELLARLNTPGTSGVDGYLLDIAGSTWGIYKIVNNSQFLLASGTQALVNGDGIGFELIGTTIKAYVRKSGVWTQVISITDSSVSGGGNIGFAMNSAELDDFGGGNVVTAPASSPPNKFFAFI